jgi:hypothetical protein
MDTTGGGDPSFNNTTSAEVVNVINYNDVTGDNFHVYNANNAPPGATKRPLIGGFVD